MLKIIPILLLLCLSFFCNATPPNDFFNAKKVAYLLFKDHPETLYCGCKYDSKKKVNLDSCHMLAASHIKRAHQIEWEHMMPAENFGKHFTCWREKLCVNKKGRAYRGRKCCKKINPEFRKAEGELYNLWPAVGLINQLRSNYRYAALNNRQLTFG